MKSQMFKPLCIFVSIVLLLYAAINYANSILAQSTARYNSTNSLAEPHNPKLELVAHIVSDPDQFDVSGDVTAIVSDGNLVLLDTFDLAFPREISQLVMPVGLLPQERVNTSLVDVIIAGDYAYVTWQGTWFESAFGGLQVVDISMPTAPTFIASLDINFRPSGIALLDSVLYIGANGETANDGNLTLIDIADPTAPALLGVVALDGQYATVKTLQVYQNDHGQIHVFAIAHNGSLYVLDVTNPHSPAQIGAYEPPDSDVTDIALVGDDESLYAFMPNTFGLCVVDVSTPTNPTEVYTYSIDGGAYHIVADDQWALLVAKDTSIHILDISNPVLPVETGVYSDLASVTNMKLIDGMLVVNDHTQGMRFLSILGGTTLLEFGRYNTLETYDGIDIAGHYLYVAENGLEIFDIFNPVWPRHIASFQTPQATGVTVDSGYALVTDYEHGLWVVDVNQPATPTQVAHINIDMPASFIEIKGELGETAYAFVASRGCSMLTCPPTLGVVDLSNLNDPQLFSVLDDGQGFSSMALVDDYLYATTALFDTKESELLILDVSDPLSPTQVSATALPEPVQVQDIVIANGYAFISNDGFSDGEIFIIDVSDPNVPVLLDRYGPVQKVNNLAVAFDFLYVTDRYNQLTVLNISDPTNPAVVETQLLPVENIDVVSDDTLLVENGFVYVLNNGLSIWRHHNDVLGRARDAWEQPFSGVTVSADAQAFAASGVSGGYAPTDEFSGTHTLSAHLNNYSTWPLTQTVNLDTAPNDQDFYVLAQPVSGMAQPGVTTTLGYLDTRGLSTQITFYSQTLSQTANVEIAPTMAFAWGDYRFAGNAFALNVTDQSSGNKIQAFWRGDTGHSLPARVEIEYSDRGVVDESSLVLMAEVDGVWLPAASLCSETPASHLDLEANVFSASLCGSGRFALFGQTHQVWLPVITR